MSNVIIWANIVENTTPQLFQKVLYTAGDMERCLVGLERFDIMYVFRHQ